MKIDETDMKILDIIQRDGRITNTKLASMIGISQPAMLERVRRLEASGIISGYCAILDRDKIGLEVMVFVSVSLAVHQLASVDKIKKKMTSFPEVLECFQISGDDDFILKVALENINSYMDFVMNKLSKIPGIRKVKSSFVLSTVKDSTCYSLEASWAGRPEPCPPPPYENAPSVRGHSPVRWRIFNWVIPSRDGDRPVPDLRSTTSTAAAEPDTAE